MLYCAPIYTLPKRNKSEEIEINRGANCKWMLFSRARCSVHFVLLCSQKMNWNLGETKHNNNKK